ncbi:unnamed protein product [Brassica oleracea var. botrytis]
MGLRLWNPGIIRGFQKWMEHHQVGPYGKIGTAGFFDLAFSQSDQKNFRRLGKSSHGQFRVSGLHFVQVSISSLSTLDSFVKPCDKTILWNKIVSFVWCYWCCLVSIRFGVLFTVSGLGISFCISFCVWILFCLDITIGCGHIYVKWGQRIKLLPSLRFQMCLASLNHAQTMTVCIGKDWECWVMRINYLGGVQCSWLYKIGLMSPSDLIMMVLRFLSFMVGNIGILASGPVCFSGWFMIVLWYVSNIIWNMIGTIGGRGSLADHRKSNRKRCSLTKEWGREAEIMGWQMWKQGCRCLVCRHTLGIILKVHGWVPSWTAQCMVFWSRCLELLTGKRVLWLDSLNQPQKTKLTIAMDLKRSHRLARTDARASGRRRGSETHRGKGAITP